MSSTLHHMVTSDMGSFPVPSVSCHLLCGLCSPFIPHPGHSQLSTDSPQGPGCLKPGSAHPSCTCQRLFPLHPTSQPECSGTAQIPAHMAQPRRWNWGPRVGALFTHLQPLLSLSPDPRTSVPGMVSQAGEGSRGDGTGGNRGRGNKVLSWRRRLEGQRTKRGETQKVLWDQET